MKIIHTGDVHLGSVMRNLPGEKAALRKTELMDGFRRLCTYARENAVTAVLIAGDLFDGNTVSAELKKEVFACVESAKPVCFFYVSGNHDDGFAPDFALPENFYVFSNRRGWGSYDLPENVTVTGIDQKYLTPDQYAYLNLRQERFNILLMHGELGSDIALERLQNRGIDYLALGHIHLPTTVAARLDIRGRFRYCGCLEGRGFDECGKRGFFLLEVQNGKLLGEKFFSLAKREICQRGVDISACESYYDVERAAFFALQDVRAEDIVKLVLCGRYKPYLRKDIPLLTTRLSEKFFFAKVVDESRLFIDPAQYQNDLTDRGEFVREVGRYELSDEEREEILEVGLKALAGEDIDL